MFESMVEWMSYPLYYAFAGASPPARSGAAHATIYPYGPFAAGDGHLVILGVQNEREWQAFCKQVLERPDLAEEPRYASNALRAAARDELQPLIAACFARFSCEQLIARLDAAQIANARMNDLHDVWQHPQLAARARWSEVATPAGQIPALLPPGNVDSFTPRMDAVPALGQHTDAILGELGWEQAEIARLRHMGAI